MLRFISLLMMAFQKPHSYTQCAWVLPRICFLTSSSLWKDSLSHSMLSFFRLLSRIHPKLSFFESLLSRIHPTLRSFPCYKRAARSINCFLPSLAQSHRKHSPGRTCFRRRGHSTTFVRIWCECWAVVWKGKRIERKRAQLLFSSVHRSFLDNPVLSAVVWKPLLALSPMCQGLLWSQSISEKQPAATQHSHRLWKYRPKMCILWLGMVILFLHRLVRKVWRASSRSPVDVRKWSDVENAVMEGIVQRHAKSG